MLKWQTNLRLFVCLKKETILGGNCDKRNMITKRELWYPILLMEPQPDSEIKTLISRDKSKIKIFKFYHSLTHYKNPKISNECNCEIQKAPSKSFCDKLIMSSQDLPIMCVGDFSFRKERDSFCGCILINKPKHTKPLWNQWCCESFCFHWNSVTLTYWDKKFCNIFCAN